MIEKGEDWNGLIRVFMFHLEIGPIHHPFCISLCTILLNSPANSTTDSLLGGDCVLLMGGRPMWKPQQCPVTICEYFSVVPALWNASSYASGWYGVRALSFLCLRTPMGSVRGCTTPEQKCLGSCLVLEQLQSLCQSMQRGVSFSHKCRSPLCLLDDVVCWLSQVLDALHA